MDAPHDEQQRQDDEIIARALFLASMWLDSREEQFPGEAGAIVDVIRRRYPGEFTNMLAAIGLWRTASALGFQPGLNGMASEVNIMAFLERTTGQGGPLEHGSTIVDLSSRRAARRRALRPLTGGGGDAA